MSLFNAPCTTCDGGKPTEDGTPKPLGDNLFESRLTDLMYRLGRDQARPDENGQMKVAAGIENKDGKRKVRVVDAANKSAIEAYKLDTYTVADCDNPFPLTTPDPASTMGSYPTNEEGKYAPNLVREALGRLLDEV